MRLTMAGEYAVRCILYLCAQKKGVIVSRREVARKMEIPEQFLSKIAQQLAKAGIIEIIQGVKGGYRLIVAPKTITMLSVVEAVTGEIFLNTCVLRPNCCDKSPTCAVHKVWQEARTKLRQTLRQVTFADLVAEEIQSGNLIT